MGHFDKTNQIEQNPNMIISKYIAKLNQIMNSLSRILTPDNRPSSPTSPKTPRKMQKNAETVLTAILTVLEDFGSGLESDADELMKQLFRSQSEMELTSTRISQINLSNQVYLSDNDLYKHEKEAENTLEHLPELGAEDSKTGSALLKRRRKSSFENISEITNQDKSILVSKILKEYHIHDSLPQNSDHDRLFLDLTSLYMNQRLLLTVGSAGLPQLLASFVQNCKSILKSGYMGPAQLVYEFVRFFRHAPQLETILDLGLLTKSLGAKAPNNPEQGPARDTPLPALFENFRNKKELPGWTVRLLVTFIESTRDLNRLFQQVDSIEGQLGSTVPGKASCFDSHRFDKALMTGLAALSLKMGHSEHWQQLHSGQMVYKTLLKLRALLRLERVDSSMYLSCFEFINQIRLEDVLVQNDRTRQSVLAVTDDLLGKLTHRLKSRLDLLSKTNTEKLFDENRPKGEGLGKLERDIRNICVVKLVLNRNARRHAQLKKLLKLTEKYSQMLRRGDLAGLLRHFNERLGVRVMSVSMFVREFSKEIRAIVDHSELLDLENPAQVAQKLDSFVELFYADDFLLELLLTLNFISERLHRDQVHFECVLMNDANWFGSLFLALSQCVNFVHLVSRCASLRSVRVALRPSQFRRLVGLTLHVIAKINKAFGDKLVYLRGCRGVIPREWFNLELLIKCQFRVLRAVKTLASDLPSRCADLSWVRLSCQALLRVLFAESSLENGFVTIFASRGLFDSHAEWLDWVRLCFKAVVDRSRSFAPVTEFLAREMHFDNQQESVVFNFVDSFYGLYKQGIFDSSKPFDRNFLDWLYALGADNGRFVDVLGLLLSFADYDFTKKVFTFLCEKIQRASDRLAGSDPGTQGAPFAAVSTLLDTTWSLLRVAHFKSFCLYEKLPLVFLQITDQLRQLGSSKVIPPNLLIPLQTRLFKIACLFFDIKIGIRALLQGQPHHPKALIEDLPLETHSESYIRQIMLHFQDVLGRLSPVDTETLAETLTLTETLLKCVVLLLDNASGKSVLLNMLMQESVGASMVQVLVCLVQLYHSSQVDLVQIKGCARHSVKIILSFSPLDKHQNAGILNMFINRHISPSEGLGTGMNLCAFFGELVSILDKLIEQRLVTSKANTRLVKEAQEFSAQLQSKMNQIGGSGQLRSVYNTDMPTEITQRYSLLGARSEERYEQLFPSLFSGTLKPKLVSNFFISSFICKSAKIWKVFKWDCNPISAKLLFDGKPADRVLASFMAYLHSKGSASLEAFVLSANRFGGSSKYAHSDLFSSRGVSRLATVSGSQPKQVVARVQSVHLKLRERHSRVILKLPLVKTRKLAGTVNLRNYLRRKHRRILENIRLSLLLLDSQFKTLLLRKSEVRPMGQDHVQTQFEPALPVAKNSQSNLPFLAEAAPNPATLIDSVFNTDNHPQRAPNALPIEDERVGNHRLDPSFEKSNPFKSEQKGSQRGRLKPISFESIRPENLNRMGIQPASEFKSPQTPKHQLRSDNFRPLYSSKASGLRPVVQPGLVRPKPGDEQCRRQATQGSMNYFDMFNKMHRKKNNAFLSRFKEIDLSTKGPKKVQSIQAPKTAAPTRVNPIPPANPGPKPPAQTPFNLNSAFPSAQKQHKEALPTMNIFNRPLPGSRLDSRQRAPNEQIQKKTTPEHFSHNQSQQFADQPKPLPSFPISGRSQTGHRVRISPHSVWRPSNGKNYSGSENPVLRDLTFSDDETEPKRLASQQMPNKNDAFMRSFNRRYKY